MAVQTIQEPPSKEKKRQRKKSKSGIKRTGRALLGGEHAQDPEWWSEEDCVWWSNRKRDKKVFRKVMKAFGKVDFALPHQIRVQAMISTRTKAKAKAKTKKKKARKVLILNPDFQPLKHPVKKDMAMPWESDDWSSSQWLYDACGPAAGCSCTRAHTAWMVAPSVNLANHPTQVITQHHCAVLLNKDTFARDFSCTPIHVPC